MPLRDIDSSELLSEYGVLPNTAGFHAVCITWDALYDTDKAARKLNLNIMEIYASL
jgi:hypothetical protein